MIISDKKTFWLKLIAVCVIAYFTIFNQLERLSLRWWDESSYALNAQEMIERKNPIVLYLKGAPDHYNSKPPFAIWCMAIGIKVFGLNELGIRLASSLFGFATVLLLFLFLTTYLKNSKGGIIAAIVLCSSSGYMGEHIVRTGDIDSILAFWILAYVLSFLVFVLSTDKKKQNLSLIITALFISLACLTKGISGLLAVPGLFAWIIIDKKVKSVFYNRYFYVGLILFIFLVPGYYFLREMLDPGFFSAVVQNEIGGRLHQQEFLNPVQLPFYIYYSRMILENRCMPWVLVLPIAILSIVFSKKSTLKTAGLFVSLAILSVSAILAFSQTKSPWYDAPLYPLFALVIGLAFAILFETYSETKSHFIQQIMTWGLIFCLSFPAFLNIINDNIHKEDDAHLRGFFSHFRNELHKNDNIIAINGDPYYHITVYLKNDQLKGYSSCQKNPNDTSLKINDILLTYKREREIDINNLFVVDTLESYYECKVFRIKGIK